MYGEGTSTLVYCDMCEYASNRQRGLERHTYKAHYQNNWQNSEASAETIDCQTTQAKGIR